MTRVQFLLARQPAPAQGNGGQEICSYLAGYLSQDAVSADLVQALRERANYGEMKHGFRLRSHNGRDALADSFQEAVDLIFYLTQSVIESNQSRWSQKLLWKAIELAEEIIRADIDIELAEVPEPLSVDPEMSDLLDDILLPSEETVLRPDWKAEHGSGS